MHKAAWAYLVYATVVDSVFVAGLMLGTGKQGDILFSPADVVVSFVLTLIALPAILPWIAATLLADAPLTTRGWTLLVATMAWTAIAWSVALSALRRRTWPRRPPPSSEGANAS